MTTALDMLSINTLRTLAIDVIQKADSGHPGLPLGASPMAYVLWQRHLKHCPTEPGWADRDRFVLSAGHGSMLLYGLLHLTGYPLPLEEVLNFRQWGSKTPGHPEFGHTPGVEATTGPLGQGHANAVGMALAERLLANRYNKPGFDLFNHHTYFLVGDGCLMEGVATEAASLAGHLKLGKLIGLYDANNVTLDGPLALSFNEDVGKRYEAYGWQVLYVKDGNTDLDGIDAAIRAAKAETGKPSLIIVTTTIGFGSPNKAGKSSAHGSPLGEDEIKLTKKALGWDFEQKFFIPPEALANFRAAVPKGEAQRNAWNALLEGYAKAHPELAAELKRVLKGEMVAELASALPSFPAPGGVETRVAAGQALTALVKKVPELIGGDADLSGSTKTAIKDGGSFDGQTGAGRNLHFGVREHAMAAVANGMSYHGGVRPYTATFFCFTDYMRPAVRLAAMSKLPVVHVWTHDSIGLGEDGPTHQPVEHLMAMRTIPNLHVVRPGDAAEAAEAWVYALKRTDGPTGLVLSRQKMPTIDRAKFGAATGLHQGAYVVAEATGGAPKAILMGTGSELGLAMTAREELEKAGVPTRVVSFPCFEAFAKQPAAYKESVLPAAIKARVSIEAGLTHGWERWVGERGIAIGVDTFGASAPDKVLYEQYGVTVAKLVAAAKSLVG
jgi:transketolase